VWITFLLVVMVVPEVLRPEYSPPLGVDHGNQKVSHLQSEHAGHVVHRLYRVSRQGGRQLWSRCKPCVLLGPLTTLWDGIM
jgi:hypothetical protein